MKYSNTRNVQASTEVLERVENWQSYVERHGQNWWSIEEAFAIVNDLDLDPVTTQLRHP